MPSPENHTYLRICAELANCLSVSLSSARRKVDIQARQDEVKDLPSRILIAKRLLKQAQASLDSDKESTSAQLDNLLLALKEDENFMIED